MPLGTTKLPLAQYKSTLSYGEKPVSAPINEAFVGITVVNETITEGAQASFRIERTGLSTIPVAVTVELTQPAAGKPGFVDDTPIVVNFNAGVLAIVIAVPTLNSAGTEGTRTATATLTNAAGCAIRPDQTHSMVTIVDAAAASLSIAVEGSQVTEPQTGTVRARFIVSRGGGTTGSCSCRWVRSGTITDDDLLSSPGMTGTVTFLPNDTDPKNIDFDIKADDLVESNPSEYIELLLDTPLDCVIPDATKSARITVIDTDVQAKAILTITCDQSTIQEGAAGVGTTLTFRFKRGGNIAEAVTAQYVVSGTTDANDFVSLPSSPHTVAWPAGNQEQVGTITLRGDNTVEANETLILTLQSPSSNAELGTPHSVTVTVVNDDSTTLPSGIGVPVVLGGPGNRNYRPSSPAYMTVLVEKIDSPLVAVAWNNRYNKAEQTGYSNGNGGEISIRVRKATISGSTLSLGTVLGETARIVNPVLVSSWNTHWQAAGGSGAASASFSEYPTVRFQSSINLASAGVKVGDLLAFEFQQFHSTDFVSINGLHCEGWELGTPRSFGAIYDQYRWFRAPNDEDKRKIGLILLGYQDGAVKGQPWMGLDNPSAYDFDLVGDFRIREVIPISQSGRAAQSINTIMTRPTASTANNLVLELRAAGGSPGGSGDEGTLLASGTVTAASVIQEDNLKHPDTALPIISVNLSPVIALQSGKVYYVVARSTGASTKYRFRQMHRFLNQPDFGLKKPDFLNDPIFKGQYNDGTGWANMVGGEGTQPRNDAPLWIAITNDNTTPAGPSPMRRIPSGKHVIAGLESPLSGPTASLAAISHLVYQGVYFNDARKQWARYADGTEVSGRVDHSDAGCQAHARYWVQFLIDRKITRPYVKNFMWWDWEGNGTNHINVPASCINAGWSPSHTQAAYIATYDIDAISTFRAEAVRWQAECAKYCYQFAAERGLTNFEIGSYNIPSKPGYPGTASYTTQKNETKTQLFDPYLSFGGGPMYFSGSSGSSGYRSKADYIYYAVNMVNGIRAAYGTDHRIMPVVWPRFFGQSTGSQNDPNAYPGNAAFGIPGGTYMVPAGWMRDYVNALLDAGANGIFIWRSSGDDDYYPTTFSQRWQEVVDLVNQRGTFILPT